MSNVIGASTRGPMGLSRRVALTTAGATALSLAGAQRGRSRAAATDSAATPATQSEAPPPNPVVSSWPRVFADPDFQFQFLIGLGQVYERAADVGEMFAAAARIESGDYDSWYDTFFALGERVHAVAEASEAASDAVSAREAYLRAATYYGEAYFFTDGTRDPSRIASTWETHRASFDRFAALLEPPAEPVAIPYGETTLPGYVLRVDDTGRPRPWLIMNNGSDGTASDMWSQGAAAGLRRGYNVLIFDGPGQGAALWRQQLSFRPDWERVITPVVDWLLDRPDVDPDRITILGVSQAGYWVPRALAFEHRLAAAIADPGVMDVSTSWTAALPPGLFEELVNGTPEEQAALGAEIDASVSGMTAANPRIGFTLAMRIRPYGTTTLSQTLIEVAKYNLRGVTDRITTPILIADPEGEAFWPGQSEALYEALPGPKTLVKFTAAEGADLHCEPKALGLRAQRFFDWLDERLNRAETTS